MDFLALDGEQFHKPSLVEFFPTNWNPFSDVAGGWFALDRLMVIRMLSTVCVVLFFAIALRKPKLVPGKLQNIAEFFLDFVRIHIAEDILGKKEGNRFLPVIVTIFFAVFGMNLPAVIPFLNVSPNSRIGMPLVLAVFGWIAFIYAGSARYGFFDYMKSSLMAPGVHWSLYILLIPIEFISTFILRPVTLTLRLMANMLAGHLILVLFFSATNFLFWQFLVPAQAGWSLVSIPSLLFGFAFTLFELLVIFLQAYIFALLVAVYIELALHAKEH